MSESFIVSSSRSTVREPANGDHATKPAIKVPNPLNRACEQCRTAKVKCFVDTSSPTGRCRRCSHTNRNCIFAFPARRKPRVCTDTRVKELEKKLRAVEALIDQTTYLTPQSDHRGEVNSPLQSPKPDVVDRGKRTTADSESQVPRVTPGHAHQPGYAEVAEPNSEADWHRGMVTGNRRALDVVDRGIISLEMAEMLFKRFSVDFLPQYPIVDLPEGIATEHVRETRLTLFLAVLAAASGILVPSIFRDLNTELLQVLASRVVVNGEKTLELVQAMIIMAAWYFPPDRFENLKHYQYIHMAATMAMDIGLGDASIFSRPELDESPASLSHTSPKDSLESIDSTLGRCRTILACYLLCASVAVTWNRPNMLHFTDFMANCVSYLKRCREHAIADQTFVAWVELQLLAEDGAESFMRSTGGLPSIVITATQKKVHELNDRFENWKDGLAGGVMNDSLDIQYHFNKAKVFEVVLYGDHDIEDFRPPFLIRSASAETRSPPPLSPLYVRAVLDLVATVHHVLEAFLRMGQRSLQAAPIINYIRACYSMVILVELSMCSQRPCNELCKVIDAKSLKIDHYMHQLVETLSTTAGSQRRRVPEKFHSVITRLDDWLRRQNRPDQQAELHEHFFRPLADLETRTVEENYPKQLPSRSGSHRQQGWNQEFPSKTNIPSDRSVVVENLNGVASDAAEMSTAAAAQPRESYEGGWDIPTTQEGVEVSNWALTAAFGPQDLSADLMPMELDEDLLALFNDMSKSLAMSSVPDVVMDHNPYQTL